MATAVVAGSTGLVVRAPTTPSPPTSNTDQGSGILSNLLAHPSFSAVYAYSRRELPNPESSTKLKPLVSTTPTLWPTQFPASASPKILFSGLATTRAAAGGFEAQRTIDYDLNLALATAAKEAGVETYVLISSHGASSSSMFAYMKMKGELEDSVKALGFKHTVFVRPGFIAGERSNREAGVSEVALRWVAKSVKGLSPALANPWAQEASVISRASVVAGVRCLEGKREEGVWEVGQAEIVAMGKE
jgi:hypothetical protein